MPSLSPSRTNSLILVALLFLQMLLMAGSARRKDGATSLEAGVVWLTSPVSRFASWIGGGVRGGTRSVRETFDAKAENEALRREVLELRSEVMRLREDREENRRLRNLLDMRENFAPESIGGSVVGVSMTAQSHILVVDRGAGDGVEMDDAVVAWGGAVGRVIYVDEHFAKVLLLTDPNSGVAGVIQRSRTEGMLLGLGTAAMEMKYVSGFADVVIGDVVVTSGLDGIFPPGFTIGHATFVGEGGDVSRPINVTPDLDPRSLEEVLVLLEPTAGHLLPAPEAEADR
jgi:rod shape-determining protein MreC